MIRPLNHERGWFAQFASVVSFLNHAETPTYFTDRKSVIAPIGEKAYRFLGSEAEAIAEAASLDCARRLGAPLSEVEDFSRFRRMSELREKKRRTQNPPPPPRTLELTRLWHPLGAGPEPDWARGGICAFTNDAPVVALDKFWVYGEWHEDGWSKSRTLGCVFGIDPETLQAESYPLPEFRGSSGKGGEVAVFPDFILVARQGSFLAVLNRASGKWTVFDRFKPVFGTPIGRIGEEVFLVNLLTKTNRTLVAINLRTHETRVVASPLRNPPGRPAQRLLEFR